MTPEELNRTMEFIVEHQAKFSADLGDLTAYFKQFSERQEQDREDRIKFENWSKGITTQVVKLLEYQSGRLDWNDKEAREARKRHEELRREMQAQHREAMARLDRFLDKLSDKLN